MQFLISIFVLLLTFVIGLGFLARRLVIPYPILFVIGGLGISFFPRLPRFTLDPDVIFFLFLPPLLYIQAFYTSWRDFRRELRAISLLAVGLVLATTVSVAYAAHWLIPNFSLTAGFVLGAIVSPPDAIAASAIAKSLGLPRRTVTILEGESLVNDATGLVAFKISLAAVAASVELKPSLYLPADFAFIAAGGILVGLVVGYGIAQVRRLMIDEDPQILLAISLLTPFVSYLLAEPLQVSGVLAVVTTGLYLGWESPLLLTPVVRLQARAIWGIIIYLLNGIVFILIGLQLPAILDAMKGESWPQLVLYAVVINATCILIRLFWVFPGAYLPRLLSAQVRQTEEFPPWREVLIIGWAGMRGVVSLAAALALAGHADFPEMHLIQFLAFSVILTTLVFQGLTLPYLITWLGVGDDGIAQREELEARHRMVEAVLEKIQAVRQTSEFPERIVIGAEQYFQERAMGLKDDLYEQLGWSDRQYREVSGQRLRKTIIETQRLTLIELRRTGKIGDDVMHELEHELDLEEARLKG